MSCFACRWCNSQLWSGIYSYFASEQVTRTIAWFGDVIWVFDLGIIDFWDNVKGQKLLEKIPEGIRYYWDQIERKTKSIFFQNDYNTESLVSLC